MPFFVLCTVIPMPLTIYTSNRMEHLVTALAGVLAVPPDDPLTPELIVMQSRGMQRWLTMELAGRFGIWANCACPFPNALVADLFRRVLPEEHENDDYSREVLTWRILKLLPSLLATEAAAPLRHYCGRERDGLGRFQLAERIADTFDQYTLFRPEMLLAWENGAAGDGDQQWQAELWRLITAESRGNHRARLRSLFRERLRRPPSPTAGLPARMALFGISYLPGYHLSILEAAARHIEINLFLLSPTREYWADIIPRRRRERLTPLERAIVVEGNPLLASLGRLGRDFSDLALNLAERAGSQQDLYHDPGSDTLLHALQSDMLNLRGADSNERLSLDPGDRSVMIHSCHGPMRELEVLHDNLLFLLDSGSGLECRDIVVMTPDIETYAPYIAAVFGATRDPARSIPYSIADRRLASEGETTAAFLKLLALPTGRLTAVELLDLLATPPVRSRFELNEEDIPLVRDWLEESGIRWGLDEADRSRHGLPGYRDHSWMAGLDRLLLGLAMPDEGLTVAGILPFDAMEGARTRILGCLLTFVVTVRRTVEALNLPRPLADWRYRILSLLDDFLVDDDAGAHERSIIAGIAESLDEIAERSGFRDEVEPALIRAWFAGRLQQQEQGQGFMTGGVTFCAMLPMRSIPFRVVALIGMNDGAFPRKSRPPGFDLIARHPRPGDRSLRDEDRYLFLEALLSARDCLYISYVGQSLRDNGDLPPSVLVSECIDCIERRYRSDDGQPLAERLVTRHPLHPFSSAYFTPGSGLFSYGAENATALQERTGGLRPAPFIAAPLGDPAAPPREVALEQLIRCFSNPSRWFLEQRLGIRFPRQQLPLEEREPFGLEGLTAYQLRADLLQQVLDDRDPGQQLAALRGRGLLPPGRHGELLLADELETLQRFAPRIRQAIAGENRREPLEFSLEIDGCLLSGRLDRIHDSTMLRYRYARLKATDLLRTWLEHLALNAAAPPDYPRQTLLIQSDGSRRYRPVGTARELLAELLTYYRRGLSAPLPFFPESSLAWARSNDPEKTRRQWRDSFAGPGEGSEPHIHRCFGDREPFGEEFRVTAAAILGPLLHCLAEEPS
ncbi:exodeoxyribonuclease V subunit gamma [Trichlorobacter ammonificans]|uniref:RecBCD enzyme subunit RecC n=1 Tax=Trichlorobacter ammonificans TaxID=2916410 RepID=A0ABM9D5I5_9BACT|nr:exodeoxyribonuclease V subunit gamma [Trichlorobacter ammonificans]CAH2030504.1 RecBCD enzyme subunit RecC [Trichlorobacter ammonificans]